VIYDKLRDLLPSGLRRYVLHFETQTDTAVAQFAATLPPRAQVLDAGAGETQYKHLFAAHRYCALDLAVGDTKWDYSRLDAVGDLAGLPFRDGTFDACISIVTLEHVRQPSRVIQEMSRSLSPGGRLLLVAPQEWEVHQQPHDYFRYTRYGLDYLLREAGFEAIEIRPVGGFFRLLSRRMFNAIQFFPGPLAILAAIFLAPAALLLPLFDGLDRDRNFTLGYICFARKSSR
jgi:SAM-dependent methyltransferase